jgi:uncharacterized membrane protein
MEEDKLLKELECVRKELRELQTMLKKDRKENSFISSYFFLIPIGLAIFLYFTNILNEAINVKAIEWVAWLGIIMGILMMIFPSILASKKKGLLSGKY